MSDVVLGCTVTDKITGFTGVVTGIVHYITGCDQALVSPPLSPDGAFRESTWVDLQRLDVKNIELVVLDNSKTPGFGPKPPKR